ncbi:MAG: ABC transporter permease subunit [Candidatus Tectomicrobia bacterium]|nr:ABC transporter permease subunit [Candidatus Tectomicrobia bacterium]
MDAGVGRKRESPQQAAPARDLEAPPPWSAGKGWKPHQDWQIEIAEEGLVAPATQLGLLKWFRGEFSWKPIAAFLGVALCWQILSLFAPAYIIPGVPAILRDFVRIIVTPELLYGGFITWARLTGALLASLLIGIPIGIVMGMFRGFDDYFRPVLKFWMGVPALNWVIIVIIWFNVTEIRIGFVLLAVCGPIYVFNIYDGIHAIDQKITDMVLSFGASHWQMVRILYWPQVKAYAFTATKINIGVAVRIVIVAELVGAPTGIGKELSLAMDSFEMSMVLAWTLWMIFMLQVLEVVVEALELKVLRWRLHEVTG